MIFKLAYNITLCKYVESKVLYKKKNPIFLCYANYALSETEREKGEGEKTKSNCSSKFLELRNVSRIFTFEVIFSLEEFVCSHFLAEISRELSEEGKTGPF